MAAPLLLLLLLLAVAAAEKNKHCELIGCVFLVTVSSDETHSTTPPPPPAKLWDPMDFRCRRCQAVRSAVASRVVSAGL